MTEFASDDPSPGSGSPRMAATPTREFRFSQPTERDGAAIYRLVREGGTLEPNSPYAYLLAGAHFGETSVIARDASTPCGFVWAYLLPRRPATLFVWQIGVSPRCRGEGLGHALLREALSRPACRHVDRLEATVTPSNTASMALFQGFGRKRRAPVEISPAFDKTLFPGSTHETELLLRIGPLRPANSARRGQ